MIKMISAQLSCGNGGSRDRKEFKLNTGGCCFLCLSESARNIDEKNSGNPCVRVRSASLSVLLRYLQISLSKNFTSTADQSIVGLTQALKSIKKSDFLVEVCGRCQKVVEKASELVQMFEILEMEVTHGFQKLRNCIEEGDDNPHKVGEYQRRMKSDICTSVFLESVDNLRKTFANKCFNLVSSAQPKVMLSRIDTMEAPNARILLNKNFGSSSRITLRRDIAGVRGNGSIENSVEAQLAEPIADTENDVVKEPFSSSSGNTDSAEMEVLRTESKTKRRHKSYLDLLHLKGKCDICHKQFSNNYYLRLHRNAVHLNIKLPCENVGCQRSFCSEPQRSFHKKRCKWDGAQIEKCGNCARSFLSGSKLYFSHIAKCSQRTLSEPCKGCRKRFWSQKALRDHYYHVHKKGKKYSCSLYRKVSEENTPLDIPREPQFSNSSRADLPNYSQTVPLKVVKDGAAAEVECTVPNREIPEGELEQTQNIYPELQTTQNKNASVGDTIDAGSCQKKVSSERKVKKMQAIKRGTNAQSKVHLNRSVEHNDPKMDGAPLVAANSQRDVLPNLPRIVDKSGNGNICNAENTYFPQTISGTRTRNNPDSLQSIESKFPSAASMLAIPDDGSMNSDQNGANHFYKRKRKYECDICHKKLPSNPKLTEHRNAVHLKIKLPCQNIGCSRDFPTEALRSLHTTTCEWTGLQVLKCNHCNRSFRSGSGLYPSHVEICSQKKLSEPCSVCQKRFSSSKDLDEHYIYVHRINQVPGRLLEICNVCQTIFANRTDLRKHNNIVHRKSEYVCRPCNKVFCTKASLAAHCHNSKIHIMKTSLRISESTQEKLMNWATDHHVPIAFLPNNLETTEPAMANEDGLAADGESVMLTKELSAGQVKLVQTQPIYVQRESAQGNDEEIKSPSDGAIYSITTVKTTNPTLPPVNSPSRISDCDVLQNTQLKMMKGDRAALEEKIIMPKEEISSGQVEVEQTQAIFILKDDDTENASDSISDVTYSVSTVKTEGYQLLVELPGSDIVTDGPSSRTRNSQEKSSRSQMWPTRLTCNLCGKTYSNKNTLKNHSCYARKSSRRYLCRICNKAFPYPSMLLRHYAISDHQNDTKKKLVTSSSTVAEGGNIFNGDPTSRKYVCSPCNKAFASVYVFRKHLQSSEHRKAKTITKPKLANVTSSSIGTAEPIISFMEQSRYLQTAETAQPEVAKKSGIS